MARPFSKALILAALVLLMVGCGAPAPQPPAGKPEEPIPDKPPAFFLLCERLTQDGFDDRALKRYYEDPGVTFEQAGISLFFHQNESKLNYDQFLGDAALRRARDYMQAQQQWLDAAQSAYHVEKEIVTAILLVETRFGAYLGSRPSLNTLSSLAALSDPAMQEIFWQAIAETTTFTREAYAERAQKKAAWAYGELKALLTYMEREKIADPIFLRGSFAGAMGIPQFMPSNIIKLGVDGDKDGRIDLFTHPDAILSVASFLSYYGWKPDIDQPTAYRILLNYNYSRPYAETILKVFEQLKAGPT